MPSIYTVVMDDGDGANELESFPTHKEALDYLKQQVHDWNNTDKWDMTKKRLAMVIAENGLELELIEETPSSDFEYHETWNSIFGWSGDSQWLREKMPWNLIFNWSKLWKLSLREHFIADIN